MRAHEQLGHWQAHLPCQNAMQDRLLQRQACCILLSYLQQEAEPRLGWR
jgi:hypothetical protein